MKEKKLKSLHILTEAEYRQGVHYAWDAAAHKAAADHHGAHGVPWTREERNAWIDTYMTSTPMLDQIQPTRCVVCARWIEDCTKQGMDPWQIPQDIYTRLASYGVKVKRHARHALGLHDKPF